MKKLMMTFVLLLVFSGSVIASPFQNGTEDELSKVIVKSELQLETQQTEGEVSAQGSTCWQCTSYTYINGTRVCTSGVWRTTCPVSG